jgi:hypothetical protein
MRDFLRFLFSAADQVTIDAASIVNLDISYDPAPDPGQPCPQALQLSFQMGVGAPMPQLQPLFPGRLTFIPDAAAAGITPTPAQVDFTLASYAGWKTIGTLIVTLDPKYRTDLESQAAGLEILPNRVWYSPVQITSEFLFTTLRNGLRKERLPLAAGGSIGVAHADWPKHAIARFLSGRYEPLLMLGAHPDADDVAVFPMPAVVDSGGGMVDLLVTTAFTRDAQDGTTKEFDALAPGVSRQNPAHPLNGNIPARHVYRSLRATMIDAIGSVPDVLLADWPVGPRYHGIRFTRTWQPVENFSVHIAQQQVLVQDQAPGAAAVLQLLPAHGMFYLWQDPPGPPPTPLPDAPHVQISTVGSMKWVDGRVADSWRLKGDVQPLDVDLQLTPGPHICLRRPMSEEILVEPIVTPGEDLCTYLSMRRDIRALINNRITGGRLSFGVGATSTVTAKMIDDAWAGTPANSGLVAGNLPSTAGPAGQARTFLEPVLKAFFPTVQPGHTLSDGEIAYNLWQSIFPVMQAAATRGDFEDAHVGRGAPGALVSRGLATFHLDPAKNPSESDDDFGERIVVSMLTGLETGASLQFWNLNTDFELLKSRTVPAGIDSFGHSPIFLKFEYDSFSVPTNMVVIDQRGATSCAIVEINPGKRRITWHGNDILVWVAANWDE